MKCELKNIKMIIPVIGDGGYHNQSTFSLVIEEIGKIVLSDPWNLTFLENNPLLKGIARFELGIPSGTLESRYEVDCVTQNGELILSSKIGLWEGKQAGLLGGMSGYGHFEYEEIDYVFEGTFLIPSDGVGNKSWYIMWKGQPVFLNQGRSHRTSWEQYQYRQTAMREIHGYEKTHERASLVANILAIPSDQISPTQIRVLEEWWKDIEQAVDSYSLITAS